MAVLDQPVFERPMLSDSDLERYARQVIMPSIGEDGQEQLLAAKVLIVGAGGLGHDGVPATWGRRHGHGRAVAASAPGRLGGVLRAAQVLLQIW